MDFAGALEEDVQRCAMHRMSNLLVQLKLKNKEIASYEHRLSKHEAQEKEYAQMLMCVNRLWDQLTSDIATLCEQHGIQPEQQPEASTSGASEDDLSAIDDLFLRHLLAGHPSSLKAALENVDAVDGELDDVERALQQRAQRTLAPLAALLRSLDAARAAADAAVAAKLAEAGAESVLTAENARLRGEAAGLSSQLGGLRAEQRSHKARVKLAEDRLTQAQAALRKANNEVADLEAQLSAAQRKVERLQAVGATGGGGTSGGGGAAPATPAAGGDAAPLQRQPSSAGGAAGGSGAGSEQQEGSEVALLRIEVAELRKVLAARQEEVDKERTAAATAARWVLGYLVGQRGFGLPVCVCEVCAMQLGLTTGEGQHGHGGSICQPKGAGL